MRMSDKDRYIKRIRPKILKELAELNSVSLATGKLKALKELDILYGLVVPKEPKEPKVEPAKEVEPKKDSIKELDNIKDSDVDNSDNSDDTFYFESDEYSDKKIPIVILICSQKGIYKEEMLKKYKAIKDKKGVVKTKDGRLVIIKDIRYSLSLPSCGLEDHNKWVESMKLLWEKNNSDSNKVDIDSMPKEDMVKNIIPKKPEDITKEQLLPIIIRTLGYVEALEDGFYSKNAEDDCKLRVELFAKEYSDVVDFYYTKDEQDRIVEDFKNDRLGE